MVGRDVRSVHVHEDVPHHGHGGDVILEARRDLFEEGCVGGLREALGGEVEVVRELGGDAVVEQLAVFLDDEVVRVAVEFFEG